MAGTALSNESDKTIRVPPTGLAVLALVGPAFIWCAEYIGTGEIILATRTGAILGNGVTWAVVSGIFLKYWIGMSGARYTVCTGEGMIDMFDRIPGPRHCVVWIVLVAQFFSAAISIGSVASAAGVFINSLVPISPCFGGWCVTIFSLALVWSGGFDILKAAMSLFVLIIIVGVLYVAISVFPGFSTLLQGFLVHVPAVPDWAYSQAGASQNPWKEILPLLGWAAGGFASQVWYSYWVLGAGYGSAHGREYGVPADLAKLRAMTRAGADKVRGWCRVVYTDATIAMIIGNTVTVGFLMAGAGVLRPLRLAPQGEQVATTVAQIFSSRWGAFGGFIFMFSAVIALIGTQVGQLAGWPRLLADSFRICIPGFQKRFSWKTQFRGFLVFFFCTNMIIIFSLGPKPVVIVQLSAILDGLLLTPLQALWVAIGLFVVMPRLYQEDVGKLLRPHWIVAVGLAVAFIVFGYFCVFQIPSLL
jgi:Mn2+/Fe2+ NRAMP family transporter